MTRRLVDRAMRRGYTLTRRALELLQASEHPIELLDEAIRELERGGAELRLIDEEVLRRLLPKPSKAELPEKPKRVEEDAGLAIEVDDRYLGEWKIRGSASEFRSYFRSRYERLSKILRDRLGGASELKSIIRLGDGHEAYTAAMILEKRESARAWILRVEDPGAEATIIVPKAGGLGELAGRVLLDAVAGFRVVKRDRSLIAEEIVLPDIPPQRVEKAGPDAYACLLSDIHLGSRHFRRDLFESFLDWINRGRDPEARRTRVVIVAGDLIDGVGVYPGQDKELEIKSVGKQLEHLAKLLSEIPDRVELIVGPGNHEPLQKALPQPPLPEKYRKILERSGKRITFVGNPAWIRICGRSFLVYHGQGLDDVVQNAPGFSHSSLSRDVGAALELLLKHRHLCPIYGGSTPILPLGEDLLVIREVPHVFHSGHVHVAYAGSYRGVRIVNSGTWQEQTSYQRSAGLEPTVGVAVLVNLRDLSIKVRRFI